MKLMNGSSEVTNVSRCRGKNNFDPESDRFCMKMRSFVEKREASCIRLIKETFPLAIKLATS